MYFTPKNGWDESKYGIVDRYVKTTFTMKTTYRLHMVDGVVACFQFDNLVGMTKMFEPISVYVEGKTTVPRVGHNFPVTALQDAIKRGCVEGRQLMHSLTPKIRYVVAYLTGDVLTKNHELQHAKYYLDSGYREKIVALWNGLEHKKKAYIECFLKRLGYPQHVWLDEFQAYYMTEKPNFFGIKLEC